MIGYVIVSFFVTLILMFLCFIKALAPINVVKDWRNVYMWLAVFFFVLVIFNTCFFQFLNNNK